MPEGVDVDYPQQLDPDTGYDTGFNQTSIASNLKGDNMLMKKILTSVALISTLGFTQPFLTNFASAAAQLDQSNLADQVAGTGLREDFVAQVITAGRSGILASVDLAVTKSNDTTSTGDITLEIRGVTTSGVPNATVLGHKVFPRASIEIFPALTTFDLTSLNIVLTAGEVFAVAVASENIGSTSGSFPVVLTDNVYIGGDFWGSFIQNGVQWFNFNKDTRFRTFVADPLKVVGIDIKPGSDPNSINLCSNGAVPVAILGSATFNVLDVNTENLRFAEASVKVVGKKDPHTLCSYDDVNGDSFVDLVCHFVTADIAAIDGESSTATVKGELLDGIAIEGTDSVNIVKDTCN